MGSLMAVSFQTPEQGIYVGNTVPNPSFDYKHLLACKWALANGIYPQWRDVRCV